MRHPPPEIKKPAVLSGTTGKPKGEADCHKSANCHASERTFSFQVEPGHRYGFDLFADVDGRVRLQQRCFDGFSTILLHIGEAELLADRLPGAIRAATAHKEAH